MEEYEVARFERAQTTIAPSAQADHRARLLLGFIRSALPYPDGMVFIFGKLDHSGRRSAWEPCWH
jgi:hypothetical protein